MVLLVPPAQQALMALTEQMALVGPVGRTTPEQALLLSRQMTVLVSRLETSEVPMVLMVLTERTVLTAKGSP